MGGFLSALAGFGQAAQPYNSKMLDLWQQSRGQLAKMIQETRDSSVHDPALHSEMTQLLGKIHSAKPGADQSAVMKRFQELTTVHPANIKLMQQAGIPGADENPNPPPPRPGPVAPGSMPGTISPIQGMQPDGSVAAQPGSNPIAGGRPISIPPVNAGGGPPMSSVSPTLNWAMSQPMVPPAQMQLIRPIIEEEYRQRNEQREWDTRVKIEEMKKNGTQFKVVGNSLLALKDGKSEVVYQGPNPHKFVALGENQKLIDTVTNKTVATGNPKTVPPSKPQIYTETDDSGNVWQWSVDPMTMRRTPPELVSGAKGKTKSPPSPGQFIPFYVPGNDTPSFFNPKTDQTKTIPGVGGGTVTLKPETPDEKKARALFTVTLANFDKIADTSKVNQDVFGPVSGRVEEAKMKYTNRSKPEVTEMNRMLNQAKADIRQAATGLAFSDKETQEIIDRLPSIELPYNTFLSRLKGVGNDIRTKANITTRGIIPPVGGGGNAGGGTGIVVMDPTGKPHTFSTQAQADAFKKAAGIR